MKNLSIIVLLMAIGLGMSSCKKYDEGPLLSLRSKNSRLINAWVIDKATTNGVDVSSQFPEDFVISFFEDNTYSILSNGVSESGKWEFTDDKTQVKMTEGTAGSEELMSIIMLKNTELTLEQVVLTETYTYYLVQKPE